MELEGAKTFLDAGFKRKAKYEQVNHHEFRNTADIVP